MSKEDIIKIIDQDAFNEFWSQRHSVATQGGFVFPGSDQEWVRNALTRLGEVEQLVTHLRYWEDLSAQEISTFLHLQAKTISKIEQSALTKLKQMYFEEHLQKQAI